MKRKPPIHHHVRGHKRLDKKVSGFWRGKDSPQLRHHVVEPVGGFNKHLLGVMNGYKVYLVNGTYVRDHYDINFTMGSHGQADKFVPKDEVWIDDELSEFERESLIRHELHEAELMKDGMSYEKAHESACKVEEEFREKSSSGLSNQ